jgi:murein DD-endopeptidase MepM/ murein hydrolase activator NlpD
VLLAVAAVLVSVVGLGLLPGRGAAKAAADEATTTTDSTSTTDSTTTDTSSTSSTTSTTAKGSTSSTSTTAPSSSTSTTIAGSLPAGDGKETDVGSAFGPQGAFNPAARQPLTSRVELGQLEKTEADLALVVAQESFTSAQAARADYQRQLGVLQSKVRRILAEAEAAQNALVEQAVAAYMGGGMGASVDLLGSSSPAEIELGMTMLDSVMESIRTTARRYTATRNDLSGPVRAHLDHAIRLDQELAAATSNRDRAALVDDAAGWQLEAYQDGSHVFIPGFLFPVEGPTRFVDSFGDARLSGTAEQHWHEGCDLMAAAGTPLIAVEDGVLTKYGGGDPLGGRSLVLTGTSGYWYYYAHLRGFVPTLKQGDGVTAGEVIGYVGATGDAVAPHLHFEIHDPDGQVLDSYGLLVAAWKARQHELQLPGTDPGTDPVTVVGATIATAGPPGATVGALSPTSTVAGTDPTAAVDAARTLAENLTKPGGFPRYPDGSPVFVDATPLPPPPY